MAGGSARQNKPGPLIAPPELYFSAASNTPDQSLRCGSTTSFWDRIRKTAGLSVGRTRSATSRGVSRLQNRAQNISVGELVLVTSLEHSSINLSLQSSSS